MYENPVTMYEFSSALTRPAPTREQVFALEDTMRAMIEAGDLESVDPTPKHFFADGMYVRSLPIPAGSVVTGKIHRHQHVVALIKGEATINTDRGMERISAPHIWISEPGAKRALVTHTDCEFMTMHLNPTNTQDMVAIEADVIEPDTRTLTHDIQRIYA